MKFTFKSAIDSALPRAFASALLAVVASLTLAAYTHPAAAATRILFVGNSFTHGNVAPTLYYNAANVHDLNKGGVGGVPGIFKKMTTDAGLDYDVSIEAVSGQSLEFHYNNKQAELGSSTFDVIAMQDYSTLDSNDPGNPGKLYAYSKLIEKYMHGANNPRPNANALVYLTATWARADQVYNTPGGRWNGTSIEKMTGDLHSAYYEAWAQDKEIDGVVPVGDAFLLAITSGVADRNPYDGIDSGKVNIWNTDRYHASAWGSYLEALTLYGKITGRDPRALGFDTAARELGVSSSQATALQNVAYKSLQAAAPNFVSVVGQGSGRCLDAPSTADGTKTIIWSCVGNSNQKWIRRPNGTLEAHGKCLEVFNSNLSNGADIGLAACNGGANQQWSINGDGAIVATQSGLCLDVSGGATQDGSKVRIWACHKGSNQQWTLR